MQGSEGYTDTHSIHTSTLVRVLVWDPDMGREVTVSSHARGTVDRWISRNLITSGDCPHHLQDYARINTRSSPQSSPNSRARRWEPRVQAWTGRCWPNRTEFTKSPSNRLGHACCRVVMRHAPRCRMFICMYPAHMYVCTLHPPKPAVVRWTLGGLPPSIGRPAPFQFLRRAPCVLTDEKGYLVNNCQHLLGETPPRDACSTLGRLSRQKGGP